MGVLNRESRLFRILRFLCALVLFVLLLVFLLIKPGEAVVAWVMPFVCSTWQGWAASARGNLGNWSGSIAGIMPPYSA